MKPLPRPLLADARDRCGLITVADLRSHGIVGRARVALFESGQLLRVHRGVYKLASHPDCFEQRCLAACLAAPNAALSGPTAGRIIGLRKVFTEEIHVIAREAVHLAGVTAHRTELLGRADIETRGGLRVLRPGRLLCDLAAHLDEAALESVLEQMLDRRLLGIRAARSAAKQFIAPGRPGSRRLARVLESRSSWLKPVDSDLELRVWRALDARGLRLVRQYPVLLDSGVTVHLDLAQPEIRFGVEIDHITWHGGRLDVQRDKQRDRELMTIGWVVSRVTDEDVSIRLHATVDQLIEIAAHCASRTRNDGNSPEVQPWS